MSKHAYGEENGDRDGEAYKMRYLIGTRHIEDAHFKLSRVEEQDMLKDGDHCHDHVGLLEC